MSAYSALQNHRTMVFDHIRNQAYLMALKQFITADSKVLDLGAGLGIHGLLAARVGAARVYLVEPEPAIEIAARLGEKHDLSNVQLFRSKVEQLDLPEQVDIIVSVLTGHFLLEEDLLPLLFYARDRFLASDGKMVPDRGKMFAVPVSAPDYFQQNIAKWTDECCPARPDLPESLHLDLVRQYAANTIYFESSRKINGLFLSKPVELLEMDFMTATNASCNGLVKVRIEQDALCHGWLGWFAIRLGADWLSTAPDAEATHWRQAFLPLDEPVSCRSGDIATFELKRPEWGEWTWSMSINGIRCCQSTFYSEPVSLERMGKMSGQHRPNLGANGKMALDILSACNGETTVEELASRLCLERTDRFADRASARRFILSLLDHLQE